MSAEEGNNIAKALGPNNKGESAMDWALLINLLTFSCSPHLAEPWHLDCWCNN
jgi:hypothetical protein